MKCTALPFTCTERSTHPDSKRTCTSFSHTQAKNVHSCYEIIHPDTLTPGQSGLIYSRFLPEKMQKLSSTEHDRYALAKSKYVGHRMTKHAYPHLLRHKPNI